MCISYIVDRDYGTWFKSRDLVWPQRNTAYNVTDKKSQQLKENSYNKWER